MYNTCSSIDIGGGTRGAMGAVAPLKSYLKGLSPAYGLVESCLSYNKPGSKIAKTQKINSYKVKMTKISAFWQERYTPLPHLSPIASKVLENWKN